VLDRARLLLAACLAAMVLSASAPASADQADAGTVFARAAEALTAGEFGKAIDDLEHLADRGFVHPDASYDRALAYVMRVRAGAERPGDLGRAAAGFEEALLLRPNDAEAQHGLDLVRAEITRRRSRRASDSVDVRPTLDRALVRLADEQTWGWLALGASLLLAAGLVLRRAPPGPARVTGSVLWPIAATAVAILLPLCIGARHLRLHTRPGVVVVSEAWLASAPSGGARGVGVPEGALLETSERRGNEIRVRHGSNVGWLPISSVRLLGPPS
jgi:hypothetical protein